MKKVLKIIVGVIIINIIIMVLISAFDSEDNQGKNNKAETHEYGNKIYNDSIYKMALMFLEEKNFESAKKYGLELLYNDTSTVKSKELLQNIKDGILNEIKNVETNAPKISKFRTNYDEFNKVTWYHAKATPSFGNDVSIYFGKNDNGELYKLRLVIQYYGDDWIFWKSAIFS